MHIDTKNRRLKFTGIAAITAALFCLALFISVTKTLESGTLKLSAIAFVASGISAWAMWTVIMRRRETKFRGAWAGVFTVLLAYLILAVFMAIVDDSGVGAKEVFLYVLLFGPTITGIFTVPLGGFLGHWVAKNL